MTLTFSSSANSLAIENLFNSNQAALQKSMQRLASGLKASSAADGAAIIGISSTMDASIRGLDMGSSNIQEGLSMLNTADSAMQQITNHLENIKAIAVGASNSTNTTSQFSAYQAQLTAELAAINSIAANTKYDSNVLLDGSVATAASAFSIQFGPNSGDSLDIKSAFKDNTAATLGITHTSITNTTTAGQVLADAGTALDALNTNLGLVGGFQNRLSDLANTVSVMQSNMSAAQSGIRDTDVAQETSNLTRLQILQQAGAYALAQANTSSQLALSLLPK